MTYTAKTQRVLLFSFFLLGVLLFSTSVSEYSQMIYLIPLLLLILAAVFINYRFKITNRILTFQVRIFKIVIYSREVSHEQVKSIKFKRVGWSKRSAIVQNSKGFNFRIVDFNPNSIFDDLIGYASNYKIPIIKTKDYITLEKMKSKLLLLFFIIIVLAVVTSSLNIHPNIKSVIYGLSAVGLILVAYFSIKQPKASKKIKSIYFNQRGNYGMESLSKLQAFCVGFIIQCRS